MIPLSFAEQFVEEIHAVVPKDFRTFRIEEGPGFRWVRAEVGLHHYEDGVAGPNVEIIIRADLINSDSRTSRDRYGIEIYYRNDEHDEKFNVPRSEVVVEVDDMISQLIDEHLS